MSPLYVITVFIVSWWIVRAAREACALLEQQAGAISENLHRQIQAASPERLAAIEAENDRLDAIIYDEDAAVHAAGAHIWGAQMHTAAEPDQSRAAASQQRIRSSPSVEATCGPFRREHPSRDPQYVAAHIWGPQMHTAADPPRASFAGPVTVEEITSKIRSGDLIQYANRDLGGRVAAEASVEVREADVHSSAGSASARPRSGPTSPRRP